VSSGLPPNGVSHDAETLRGYRDDTLNHSKVSPRVIRFMLDAMALCIADADRFLEPVLLQVAGDDLLVDPVGSERFFARLPVENKTMHWYDDAYHEIFNEMAPLRQRVQQDLIEWMKDRLEGPKKEF
jgi:alpha-beta hydrolase superfamily lysophospholipase